jgi:hypothetical protein
MANKKNVQTKLTPAKKLTLADLISKKLQKEKAAMCIKEIEIKSLGGSLVFTKPDDETVIDTMDKVDSIAPSTRDLLRAYDFLIYQTCQMLHNQELQDEYEVKDPIDIVAKILEVKERLQIGDDLMTMAGFDDFEDKIKN